MKPYVFMFLALLVLISITAVSADNTTIPGLNITDDAADAFNQSEAQNKTVIIIFDQESCYYCDLFKNNVLNNKTIQDELNEKFVVLLADINKNSELAVKYQVYGTPSVHFTDSNGESVNSIEGYVDSDEFLKKLKEV